MKCPSHDYPKCVKKVTYSIIRAINQEIQQHLVEDKAYLVAQKYLDEIEFKVEVDDVLSYVYFTKESPVQDTHKLEIIFKMDKGNIDVKTFIEYINKSKSEDIWKSVGTSKDTIDHERALIKEVMDSKQVDQEGVPQAGFQNKAQIEKMVHD